MKPEEYVLIDRGIAPFTIGILAYALTNNDTFFWASAIVGFTQLPELQDIFETYRKK